MIEIVGVDIGGSNLKAGRIKNGNIEEKSYIAVDSNATSNIIVKDLFKCINNVISRQTERIGIGVPGVVDPSTGIVYDIQNIPAWKEISLKKIIEEHYNLPVFINNDANCFAMGEKIFGKGRKLNDFIGLSIGTGIGMGIVIKEELYNGVLCGAGEIGMVAYRESIIENYAGSFFFTKNYGTSPEELFHLAAQNDVSACKAFNEYGHHLGEVIKNILYLFAPETIIIGGSLSKAYVYYKDSIQLSLKSFAYQKQLENFKIEISNTQGSAILGAGALCFQELNNY